MSIGVSSWCSPRFVCCIVVAGLASVGRASVAGPAPQLPPTTLGRVLAPVKPALSYQTLYSFGGRASFSDGVDPYSSLLPLNGPLYGTTDRGGANDRGTVYSIKRFGIETVVHSFGSGSDGANPLGDLLNVDGTLYGTTSGGGYLFNCGTVYSFSTTGAETVLHSFGSGSSSGSDGCDPRGRLVNLNGTFYGTTALGGAYGGSGSVYSINESGIETVLHSFGSGSDGLYPYAGLLNVKRTLYGTTEQGGAHGCGTVYSVSTTGAERVLHSFGCAGSGSDGTFPYANLLNVNGRLYGTTAYGGAYNNGTVFSISTSGTQTYTVLHSFAGSDGSEPFTGLVNVQGTLYGTTLRGGAHGGGTVYSISTTGTETVLHNFGAGADGSNPHSDLLMGKDRFFGTTSRGGTYGRGTVFTLSP